MPSRHTIFVGPDNVYGRGKGFSEVAVRLLFKRRQQFERFLLEISFDRFNGFLGLPVEFELEIPCRAPSASASVFGVSAESMQCAYDSKGNSVPTILLLMQERLYAQDGLKAEGIFRINAENGQEEHVREQLNNGIVPEDIDVHCLAELTKVLRVSLLMMRGGSANRIMITQKMIRGPEWAL